MAAVLCEPADQAWICEQMRDRGLAGVFDDETIGEDLRERPTPLVLADDVGAQPGVPAPARVEHEPAAPLERPARASVGVKHPALSTRFNRSTMIMPKRWGCQRTLHWLHPSLSLLETHLNIVFGLDVTQRNAATDGFSTDY
jgi:hypothetical protein